MKKSAQKDSQYDTEVVVVGAGPGGATLAYLLARSGVGVQLLERQRDLSRTFRGFLFQPLVLRTFDEMGILDSVLALDHHTVRAPTLTIYGRPIPVFDLESYREPFDYAILMEQPPLLRLLIDQANDYGSFEYRDATTVQDLHVEDDHVVGVHGTDREASEEIDLRARLVVGADGRYSTVRNVAGIDPGLFDSSIELIWFKLPAEVVAAENQARLNAGGILGYFGVASDEAQLGHFVEKGEYARLRDAGIEAFYDRITDVDPSLDGVLQEHVTDFDDTTLLHIEPGVSDQWVDDGVLLIGDAAHVASPVGGQGNGLAIADAVVAHAVICDALAETEGTLSREVLREYEQRRRPTVEQILQLQRRGERALTAFVRHHDRVPPSLGKLLIRGVVTAVSRSPLGRRLRDRFAWGSWEPVETSYFAEARPE